MNMLRTTIDPIANTAVLKKFTSFLEGKQLRKTPERFAVLRHALAFNRHFTIDQLQQSLDGASFHVSRATLYNTIDLLLESGIIVKHLFEGVQPQYERTGSIPHSHLVCTSCGKVKDVRDTNLAAFMNAMKFNAFNASHYSLTVYGMCSTCTRKLKRSAKKPKKNGIS